MNAYSWPLWSLAIADQELGSVRSRQLLKGSPAVLLRSITLIGLIVLFSISSTGLKPALAEGIKGGSALALATEPKYKPVTDSNIISQHGTTLSAGAMWRWMMTTQAGLNRGLTATVRGLKQDPWQGSLLLIAIAFAYGVLHAAGPGHGKAVIASYVLANGATVRRGVALSFMAAAFQALAALALVGGLVLLLGQSGRSALALERTLEMASWVAIALVGGWLLYRQLAPAIFRSAYRSHEPGCACPEHHIPSAHLVSGDWSWPRAIAIAASVGVRPCSGAILLLLFALGQGLLWAGVLGTLAMALGTALTVSALAFLAVYSRHLSIAIWGRDSRIGGGVARAFALIAALLVIAIGVTGTYAALTAPRTPDFLIAPRS